MTMSLKAIFNKVEKHLIKQNEKSIDSVNECCYRNDDGLSCAVGCLMSDAVYKYELEGNDVKDRVIMEALAPIIGVNKKKRDAKLELLNRLQLIHDDSCVANWDIKLRELKLDFKIS